MEFWSSYKFFFDTRYFTLHLCSEQPTNRTRISVPSSQWEAITQSFESAERVSWNKDSEIDVRLDVRRRQADADKVLRMDTRDMIRAAAAGDRVPSNDDFEKAKQAQLEAYKEIALWRARCHTVDEETREAEPWLTEMEVQKGIVLACQANDVEFFKSLGRILSQKKSVPQRLPFAALMMKNWIEGDLPLAIFSDDALADLCSCVAEQVSGREQQSGKDEIAHQREYHGLKNLGAVQNLRPAPGLSQLMHPIIKEVRWTGRIHPFRLNNEEVRFHELIASGNRTSVARLKRNPSTAKPLRQA